jgi:putative DNA primase/helicase
MIDNLTLFRQAMEADGLTPGDIVPGRLHRFPGVGKRNGNQAGWCKLFDDCQGGVYGDYSSGLSKTWQADRNKSYSEAERAAFREQVEKSKAERLKQDEERHAKAEKKAQKILDSAKGDPKQHPYAIRKKCDLGSRVRRGAWPQRGWADALLFPIYNSEGCTVSIQAINTDGTKDFLAGGRTKGCFYPIGKIRGATGLVVIAEGAATLAAVCLVMQCPGVAAMSAGNLEPVAREIKKLAPGAEIVIVADNDQKEAGHV